MKENAIIVAAGAVTAVAAAVTVLWGVFRWARKITEGAKCQLRSEMLSTYYHHREQKTIRQYEYENFVYCYDAYSALNGNSFVAKIKKEVDTWEIIT